MDIQERHVFVLFDPELAARQGWKVKENVGANNSGIKKFRNNDRLLRNELSLLGTRGLIINQVSIWQKPSSRG